VSELSIFVDESGDFGSSPGFYVLALVMHDQAASIAEPLAKLESELSIRGINSERAIHTGAAIRGEDVYRGMPVEVRRSEFTRLFAFARKLPVSYQTFAYVKREYPDRLKLKGAISKDISLFLRDNAERFLSFDRVIVYYDNGQAEITDILNTLLNAFFFDVEFRKVNPSDYRLFQVADLYCTIELLKAKVKTKSLSRSDIYFFESERSLRRNYLRKVYPTL